MTQQHEIPQDFAEIINAAGDGWVKANGLRFLRATRDVVVAELEIGPQHRQAYGIVHGGVYCGIVETLASVGAAVNVMPDGRSAVGLENNTSFIRAVREGKLRAEARPVTRGRRSHVWEVAVRDEQERTVATGRVRMLILEQDAAVAGEKVRLQDE
ncbi:MAG: PaaI family thioesterase [Myxococcota bacterium]